MKEAAAGLKGLKLHTSTTWCHVTKLHTNKSVWSNTTFFFEHGKHIVSLICLRTALCPSDTNVVFMSVIQTWLECYRNSHLSLIYYKSPPGCLPSFFKIILLPTFCSAAVQKHRIAVNWEATLSSYLPTCCLQSVLLDIHNFIYVDGKVTEGDWWLFLLNKSCCLFYKLIWLEARIPVFLFNRFYFLCA